MRKIIAFGALMLLINACNFNSKSEEERLAQSYCGGCHVMPSPSLLDKKTWEKGVLPQMALRLGVEPAPTMSVYGELSTDEIIAFTQANIYPETPILSKEEWEKIVKYYLTNAPDKLPDSSKNYPISNDLTLFAPKADVPDVEKLPMVSMLKFDDKTQKLYVGTRTGKIHILDGQFKQTDSISVGSAPSDVHFNGDGSLNALAMGIMDPNDKMTGTMVQYKKAADGKKWDSKTLISNLRRPVSQYVTDVDGDGLKDMMVCEFGFHLGQFSWYKQQPNQTYQAFQLDALAGARVVQPYDFNRDGKLDYFVLLAQGDEQMAVYYNRGGGRFEKQILHRFPPVYGSSYAELADFNGDGNIDILYANGDNADYSMILKPYHGIRIFLNDGHLHFKEAYFFGLNGAAKALADDFDKDGDVDIAAISYFPAKPQEGFVFLENQGNLKFKAKTFAQPRQDKWMLMEKADYDRDGDTDLLLGYLERPPYHNPINQSLRGLWVLENKKQ